MGWLIFPLGHHAPAAHGEPASGVWPRLGAHSEAFRRNWEQLQPRRVNSTIAAERIQYASSFAARKRTT